MKYTTYAENIYRPGETTPPLATAHSEADASLLAAELNRLASERDAAVEALRRIAFEPFGDAEANDRAVLDAMTECARAAIASAEKH